MTMEEDAKRELQEVSKIWRKIDSLTGEREVLRVRCFGVSSPTMAERVLSSGCGRDIDETIARIDALTAQINAEIHAAISAQESLRKKIRTIKEPLQTVLRLRYICGMRWDEVADHMRYQQREIFRFHNLALTEYQNVIE